VTSARYLCLLLVVGCATPASLLREDNRRLTQTVAELRADRRAQDRKLRDLRHQLDEARSGSVAIPALPVEIAAPPVAAPAPGAARVVGVAEDGTEIVYEGDAALARSASPPLAPAAAEELVFAPRRPAAPRAPAPRLAGVPSATDRLEVTRRIPPIAARAAVRAKTRDPEPPSERSGDAADEYRAAVELVKASKHDAAVVALRAFIASHPRHDYADNAQYWLGETFYAQKDYGHALTELRRVVEVYPRGNKVPDALLKVAYCHQALGQGDKARAILEQVVSAYPKTEPAALATRRLEAL
jgi:tol-pal system protein YbgF